MSTHDYRPHVTTVSTRAALGSVFSRDDAAAVVPRAEDARRSARLLTDEFEVDAAAIYLVEGDVLRLAASSAHERPQSQIDPRSGRLASVIDSGRPQTIPVPEWRRPCRA